MIRMCALFLQLLSLWHRFLSFRIRRILPVIGCLLVTGFAPNLVYGACLVPVETSEVAIPQWNSNSGWLPLTNNPALRSSITKLTVTVTNNDSTTGNTLHVLENWKPVAIATADVDTTTTISIPTSSTPATLQFYIAHAVGASYNAELALCDGPEPEPEPEPELRIHGSSRLPTRCNVR